jgi:uncharacterized protein YndB with AHSA1/START domain
MTQEGQALYGTLETTAGGEPQLRFQRVFHHPQEKVWRAITEPAQLAHWFPTTIDGERAAGARLRFEFPKDQLPAFDGEMLVFDPPRVMELRWGPDTLRLELHPVAEGTLLILLDTLEELGKAARDGAGWHTCLDGLAALLDHKNNPPDATERWREVHSTYVTDFGPDAATVEPPEGML